jgi:hypothetical protein
MFFFLVKKLILRIFGYPIRLEPIRADELTFKNLWKKYLFLGLLFSDLKNLL